MNIRSLTLVGLLVALGAVCSSVMVSAQDNLTISGTVFARSGSSVEGAAVIACLLKNDACDDAGSGLVQIKGSGSSAKYQLTGLAADEFVMLAWRDLNSNGDLDAGDEVGVYQKSGKATQVKAPAQNIDIRLVQFNGDLEAILQQADEAPAQASTPATTPSTTPATSSGGLALSGTVKALSGSSLDNAIVLAGVWEDGKYNQDKSKGVKVGANGKFSVTGLEKIPYVLFAWRDVDGDSDVSAGDEVAPFKPDNKFALVTPPLSNISLQFEQGDSSLDALVALTKSNANAGATTNDPKAGSSHSSASTPSGSSSTPASSSAVKTLTCLKNNFWQCKIPATPTNGCPVTKIPALNPEVGVYKGYAYGFCGRPLVKQKVVLYSTVSRGQVKTTFTDAKGFYRFDVRGVLGSYVGINAEGTFSGQTYSYYVDAINEEIGSDGAIQNFNFDTRKSQLTFVTWSFDRYPSIPDSFNLEIQFEPVALVDGSKGETQTFRLPMTKSIGSVELLGLKLGTYKITATVVAGANRYWTFVDDFGKQTKPAKTQTVTFINADEYRVALNLE
jgi:hypothetical protein